MKKNLTELRKEEQVIGWLVEVYFQRGSSEKYASITTDTKDRAESVATDLSARGAFKPKGNEKLTIIRNVEEITCVSVRPLTRTVYVK